MLLLITKTKSSLYIFNYSFFFFLTYEKADGNSRNDDFDDNEVKSSQAVFYIQIKKTR